MLKLRRSHVSRLVVLTVLISALFAAPASAEPDRTLCLLDDLVCVDW